jgi:ActR/RegA family two-component response regulator
MKSVEEKKILLVDDEEVFLEQLKDALAHIRNKGARPEMS